MQANKIKKTIVFLLVAGTMAACLNRANKPIADSNAETMDTVAIVHQLERMVANDQQIQFAHLPDESEFTRDSLYREKERIFKANTDTVRRLFKAHGYLGNDRIGKKGAYHFWLLVQHADHDIQFQQEVLAAMQVAVNKGNADGSNFAYLTDRVLVNNHEHQIYGTQVAYTDDFWVVPKPLKDSSNVNQRRKEIGLDKLEIYLNEMMELNYQMNKTVYEENGLTEPRKYVVGNEPQ